MQRSRSKTPFPSGAQAIVQGQDSPAVADLHKLVWEPLAQYMPKGTTTVYLAPDGVLSRIPWAALPGDRPGTVLLEQYALATIPHAPFLLDRLTAPILRLMRRLRQRAWTRFV